MGRAFAATLLLAVIAAATSGCHTTRAPEVGRAPLVSEAGMGPGENPQSPLPAPEGFVSDFAGVLDEETERRIETTLTEFRKSAGVDIAVVTIGTTGGRSTSDYSLALARGWGVGAGPDEAGALILVAVEDRKWHIQISRSLEKVMSNDEVARIGAVMKEPFTMKRYGEGVTECVDAFIKELSERRGHRQGKAGV